MALGAKHGLSALACRLHQPPVFLAPALAELSTTGRQSTARFSTSTHFQRDANRRRGVSALRRKYPKQALSIANEPLPKPVLDPARRTKLKAEEDHGLWGFFPASRSALMTPEEMASHGRSWTVEELRTKSWEDLHALWWVCAKDKNMILTQETERQRLGAGYGQHEATNRYRVVSVTQRAIKHVLTERWYAWQNALKETKNNPSLLESGEMWEVRSRSCSIRVVLRLMNSRTSKKKMLQQDRRGRIEVRRHCLQRLQPQRKSSGIGNRYIIG